MSIVSVQPKDFILALFIRDDGERFLLGDGGYDFKDSQLHFVGNTIENDEVAKQGTDGTLLAGQVRRSAIQSFDGYIGDTTVTKEAIEQMRRDFIAFFMKGHHFRVVYVDCARNAWQRKGGYLVDAPEVKELWQIHPEYHVALNFEDVNYYVYDENADGDEILAIVQSVPISSEVEGGLEWDANGAISEAAQMDNETKSASGENIHVTDAVVAPFADVQLEGNTSQDGTPTPSAPVAVQTVTGENVVKICGKNLFDKDTATVLDGYFVSGAGAISATAGYHVIVAPCEPNTTYTLQWSKVSPDGQNRCRIGASSTAVTPSTTGMTILANNTSSYLSPLTITTPADAHYLAIDLRGFSATSPFSDILESLQLEKGSATDYEPYQGQDYEVNLGKNLFDKYNANTLDGTITSTTVNTGGSNKLLYIKCDPNTTYTVQKRNDGDTNRFAVCSTQAEPVASVPTSNFRQDNDASVITVTTTSSARYLVVMYYRAQETTLTEQQVLDSIQIEKGSQATSYAPYFTPIELGGLGDDGAGGYLYQDYIYPSGGKWYVHKATSKVVLDGITIGAKFTERMAANNSKYRFRISNLLALPANFASGTIAPLYCDRLIGVTMGNTWNGTRGICYNDVGNSMIIFIESLQDETLAGANTWLESNNLDVYYVLATPTDTEITNEALVAQLNNLKEGGTLAGINNIAIVPAVGNETGTLEIQYYTKYSPVPIGGGYVWEEGGEGGPTTVINESIAEVYPVWTVPGPALNPTLENATTGEQIEFVGMVGEGQTLVVDMGAQTALLNGLNVISSMAGEFISLQVGQNTLLYSASGDAGASEIGWSPIVG